MGLPGVGALVLALAFATGANANAEERANDAAGREYFERGRQAFESADYESALTYFRHAYRLSQRGELQYNIGVTADRLQATDISVEKSRQFSSAKPLLWRGCGV